MALKYTGMRQGRIDLTVGDIPARDLTDEDVDKYGGETVILATGLYQKVAKVVKQNKARRPAKENK